MTKLKITVGDFDSLAERTRDRLQTLEGDTEPAALDDVQSELRFGSYSELFDVLSEKRLELLRAIATHDPDSISATAELVDRDYKSVYRQLDELEELGVVEFEEVTPRTARKPIFDYDGIEIDLDFPDKNSAERAGA